VFLLSYFTYCFGMMRTVKSSHRRPLSKRSFLLLLVGILATALVATVMQVLPKARADTVNDVQVTQHDAEVSLRAGTATCVVRNRVTFQGDEKKVSQFVESVSKSARDLGMKAEASAGSNPPPGLTLTDLILSSEFELTQYAIAPENCSTEKTVVAHRGRKVLELPSWARGLIAAVAGVVVYLAVALAIVALFTFLAPEFIIWGDIIGGCVGGFASSFVSDWVKGVPMATNLTSAAVLCIVGAIAEVAVGTVRRQIVDTLRREVQDGLTRVVNMSVSRGTGLAASEVADVGVSFRTVSTRFADAIEEIPV
jgi:hypothetical protein